MTKAHEPIACSLPLREAASQAMEWTDLHAQVVAREPTDHGVAVTYRSQVADAVEDLVRRESACCAWLSLATSKDERGIRVVIESDNPQALPVIEYLAGVT